MGGTPVNTASKGDKTLLGLMPPSRASAPTPAPTAVKSGTAAPVRMAGSAIKSAPAPAPAPRKDPSKDPTRAWGIYGQPYRSEETTPGSASRRDPNNPWG